MDHPSDISVKCFRDRPPNSVSAPRRPRGRPYV